MCDSDCRVFIYNHLIGVELKILVHEVVIEFVACSLAAGGTLSSVPLPDSESKDVKKKAEEGSTVRKSNFIPGPRVEETNALNRYFAFLEGALAFPFAFFLALP
jgi:hypothetical protein